MKSIIPITILLLVTCALAGQYYAGLSFPGEDLAQHRPAPSPTAVPALAPVWTLDERPAFPGGESALADSLRQHFQYPALARAYGLEGRVILRFTVHTDGRIGDFEVLRGPGLGLEEAVVAALKKMPGWQPARIGGRPVCSRHVLPVHLRLSP